MKKILTRTINTEILLTSLAIILVLMAVFITRDIAFYLSRAAIGQIDISNVFSLIGIRIPLIASKFFPLAILLAALSVLGRMSQDNELVILLATGFGYKKILKTILKLGLLVFLFLLFFYFYFSPNLKQEEYVINSKIKNGVSIEYLKPGKFFELQGGNRVIYAQNIENGLMKNVFLQIVTGGTKYLLKAKTGKIETDKNNNKILSLFDGTRYENTINSLQYKITNYQKHSILLPEKTKPFVNKNIEFASTLFLFKNFFDKNAQLEFQWRLAFPLMVLILVLLSVSLSKYTPRSNKFGKIIIGLLLYFVYYNLLYICKQEVIEGNIKPFLGLWLVHLIFFSIAGFLFWLATKPLQQKTTKKCK